MHLKRRVTSKVPVVLYTSRLGAQLQIVKNLGNSIKMPKFPEGTIYIINIGHWTLQVPWPRNTSVVVRTF